MNTLHGCITLCFSCRQLGEESQGRCRSPGSTWLAPAAPASAAAMAADRKARFCAALLSCSQSVTQMLTTTQPWHCSRRRLSSVLPIGRAADS